MSAAGGNPGKIRILIPHQWKSTRGLYGADKVLLRVLAELAPVADSWLVVESEGELPDVARQLGCTVEVRPMGVLRRKLMTPVGLVRSVRDILSASFWMARQIRRQKIQLVITSTVSVIPGALAARMTGCPHLWMIHEILGGKSAILSRVVSALSTRIVAVSEASAASVHRGRKKVRDKIIVAYPGITPQPPAPRRGAELRREFDAPEEAVLIGMVGRLHYWKGQGYFLEALHELKKRNVSGFRALIIGAAYQDYPATLDKLRAQAQALGLGGDVIFCGHRDDIHAMYRGLDVVASPSVLPEPFGLVVAEAMAAELPVIATNCGGPREMIEDGVSGFLIPPDDPALFAARLEQLIRDPKLRRTIGARARQRIESTFLARTFDERIHQEACALAGKRH